MTTTAQKAAEAAKIEAADQSDMGSEQWDARPLADAKPCPFCGGTAEGALTQVYWVECSDCGAATNADSTPSGALELWNRRFGSES